MKRSNRKKLSIVIIVCLFIILNIGCSNTNKNPSDSILYNSDVVSANLAIHFIDVGQGDSTLIQTPSGKTMLIDAGENDKGESVVNYIKKQGIKKLDYVIGTHPHSDHIGGLDNVINSLDVKCVYMPKVSHNTETFKDVLSAVRNKGLKVETAKTGVKLNLDQNIKLEMFSPNLSKYDNLNNYSPIMKLTYGEVSFIFTGDAEAEVEKEVLTKNINLKADILKLGHHGSSTSTTNRFLKAVSPKYAIISAGKGNEYGHPHKETIHKLINAEIQIFRTDQLGTIVAVSNGKYISFNKAGQKTVSKDNNIKYNSIFNAKNDVSSGESGNKKDLINTGVEIVNIDLEAEVVVIQNRNNTDVDMTGWKIVSIKGNQEFYFPRGYILKAGEAVTVASGESKGDLRWSEKPVYIWSNDGDKGELYDSRGNLVSNQ